MTSIPDSTFYGCTGLTEITLPAGVTSIGNDAFNGCTGLASITLPSGVTSIGDDAFSGCTGLTEITLPAGLTSIGSMAFYNCTSLSEITLPVGVTNIGSAAFTGCTGLTSITLPEGVTSIGISAFLNCTGLTDVYYGGSEEEWGNITIDSGNDPLTNAAIHYAKVTVTYTVAYNANGGTGAPASQTATGNTDLTLSAVRPTRQSESAGSCSVSLDPNDGYGEAIVLNTPITTSYTFRSWNTRADGSGMDYAPGANYTADANMTLYAQWDSESTAEALTLSRPVRKDAAFLGWSADKNARIGVTGEYTPSGDVILYAVWREADFILPASLTAIEAEAFSGGAFTCVIVPETVTEIGAQAFANCPNLRCVDIRGAQTVIAPSAFEGVTDLMILAPAGSAAETWADQHGVSFLPAA